MCPALSPPDGRSASPENAPWRKDRVRVRATVGLIAGLLLVQFVNLATGWSPSAPSSGSVGDLRLRLNPNTATVAEFELLPRIGPKLAENIIEYRETAPEFPAFRCAEDLDRVARIGPATVELLRPFLRFDRDDAAQPDAERLTAHATGDAEALAADEETP